MLYVCDRCKFEFSRTGKPEACPSCGCELISEVNKEDQKDDK